MIATTSADVLDVLAGVDDPEYPGVSIVDLGLVEDVRVDAGRVEVDLIPTFLGCPALDYIRADVGRALESAGYREPVVAFVATPVWTTSRISDTGREALGREFTVAVRIGREQPPCPRCGAPALVETSLFGSMRCRSVARCDACGEQIETIR